MEESAHLEIGNIPAAELCKSLQVVDDNFDADFQTNPGDSSSSSKGPTPALTKTAELFNLPPSSKVTVGDISVWVEFLACFSSGTFAHVYDAGRDKLLGVLKTDCRLEDSFSLQALCKVHKPAGSCKCWVTFKQQERRDQLFLDLLKWLGQRCVGKTDHSEASVAIRRAYGMKVRNKP